MTRWRLMRLTYGMFVPLLMGTFCIPWMALAKYPHSHHHGQRRYRHPLPVNPVIVWARKLSEVNSEEVRKSNAFKLSQYSQPIFQPEVVRALVKCMEDPNITLRVLCTKAMGRAGTAGQAEWIESLLLQAFEKTPELQSTIARTFVIRKSTSPAVYHKLFDTLVSSTSADKQLAFLTYFQEFGDGSDEFVQKLSHLYEKSSDIRVKRMIVKTLSERGRGQSAITSILTECVHSSDTPLILTCLSGLEQQAKQDAQVWGALEKALRSDDSDVILATLDVINVMDDHSDPKISGRLLEIVQNTSDDETREKAILALGVCGGQTDEIYRVLQKTLQSPKMEVACRVASALVLGKQAPKAHQGEVQVILDECYQKETGGLKTACELGIQELKALVAAKENPPRDTAASPAQKQSSKNNISPSDGT